MRQSGKADIFPDRQRLVTQLSNILSDARKEPPDDPHRRITTGPIHDRRVLVRVQRFLTDLRAQEWFEHIPADDLAAALRDLIADSCSNMQARVRVIAAQFLDDRARQPRSATTWFGVSHLRTSEPIDLRTGSIQPFEAAPDVVRDDASHPMAFVGPRPETRSFCVVTSSGGSDETLRQRAQQLATELLALLRLHLRQQMGGYTPQTWFTLSGFWAEEGEGPWRTGWWRLPTAVDFHLAGAPAAAIDEVADTAATIAALAGELREAAQTAVQWLDLAALTLDWRVALPHVFSAMEALLVPEMQGRKAEAIMIRSVALQSRVEGGFTDPMETYETYLWRNALVHGVHLVAVDEEAVLRKVESARWWAYRLLRCWLRFAADGNTTTLSGLVTRLDQDPTMDEACRWIAALSPEVDRDIVVPFREERHLAPLT